MAYRRKSSKEILKSVRREKAVCESCVEVKASDGAGSEVSNLYYRRYEL